MKGEIRQWKFPCTRFIFLLAAAFILHHWFFLPFACAQKRHSHSAKSEPKSNEPKQDILTLRYKPQAGTLLYDVRTQIDQRVRTERDELTGYLSSHAQLAFHNVFIDYKAGLWNFDQYFTRFQITGRQLTGDTLSLNENRAVNKITRLTYDMQGLEVKKEILDSLKLLNAEAQTNAYFFQPPRMLIPLPGHAVTYGDTWTQHSVDTVNVRDTVNVGVTTGIYIYDVSRTYRFDRLIDSLVETNGTVTDSSNHRFFALIVATDSGSFFGSQANSITNATVKTHGPITGQDTTYLDLFSGRVVRRTLRLSIPTTVELSTATPFSDFLDVRSVVVLNESNVRSLKEGW